jgi:predicted alpha/beta superfamily hydrolase
VSGWLPYAEVHGPDNTTSATVLVWPQLEGAPGIAGREIIVYLPSSLAVLGPDGLARLPRRYPTLYFHDGQNVFDERTSFVGEWHADETLELLAGEGLEAIAVAIPNGGDARMDEYNPWRGRDPRGGRRLMGGKGDAYLDWVVGAVRPLIDRSFPTDQRRAATGIIGSSMGGLISLYALLRHGDVFGLAGVMSPSIVWSDYRVLRLIEERGLRPARIHLDMGGREWRGMMADARRLRDTLLRAGLVEGRYLHYIEERYATHREDTWARRLPDALRFLLAETRS